MTKRDYVHIFRRRRAGMTDYRKRKGLISSRRPMFCVRMSNKYIYAQISEPNASGDLTICSASSRDLRKSYGWQGSCKNLPASYLAGYLLGKRAIEKKVESAVVYTGVNRFIHGSRIACLIGGARDAGLKLDIDAKVLPKDDRVSGAHIEEYAKGLDGKDSGGVFSELKSKGFDPSKCSTYFNSAKEALAKAAVS